MIVKNEELTRELQQEFSKIFRFVAQHTDGLFEQNGSIIEYCYETGIVVNNGKGGYGVFDSNVIDKLAKVNTSEFINYILDFYIWNPLIEENDLEDLETTIVLSIFANYWFRKNDNLRFFTFVYEQIISNDMCGIQYAQELLLHTLNIEELREEYPMLYLTGVPKNVVKVFIPFSDMAKYFQESNYPHLNIGNELIQAHLVYWDIDKLDEYREMYPQFSNYIDYLNN